MIRPPHLPAPLRGPAAPRPRRVGFGLAATLGAVLLALAPAAARADDDADAARRRALRRTPTVEAVETAAPAVVSIGTTQLVKVRRFWEWDFLEVERPGGLGSGVIVHPDGYVVTNAHVINQAAQIAVKLTGLGQDDEIPAELVAVDLEHDLALLRMRGPGPYVAAQFGSSRDLMVGETAICMGSPFGLGRTVTTGVVSALRRDIRIRDQMFEGMIQTDAPVNQGNSGGALLNILGEWIGVNSAIYSLSGGSDGISFAIPIETVRTFLANAMRPRRIAGRWLGLELDEREDGVVYVSRVYPVGPAATAGVREGVELVRQGGELERDIVAVTFDVLAAAQGASFPLRVLETEGPRVIEVEFQPLPTQRLAWDHVGIRVAEVTQDVTEKTGLPEASGVLVEEIREDGPADRVGIRKGDLLIGIGTNRIRTLEQVLVTLQDAGPGTLMDMKLLRPQRSRYGISYETWKARVSAD